MGDIVTESDCSSSSKLQYLRLISVIALDNSDYTFLYTSICVQCIHTKWWRYQLIANQTLFHIVYTGLHGTILRFLRLFTTDLIFLAPFCLQINSTILLCILQTKIIAVEIYWCMKRSIYLWLTVASNGDDFSGMGWIGTSVKFAQK